MAATAGLAEGLAGVCGGRCATRPPRGGLGGVGQLQEFLVGQAGRERLEMGLDGQRRAEQDEGPFELTLELLQVGLGLDGVEVEHLADDRALDAGRPGLGERDQGDALGLNDLDRELLESPPFAERAPLLQVGVLQAPAGELVAGPLVGPLHVG